MAKTLLEAFHGNIDRLVRTAWLTESMNMYPPCVEGRLSKSDLSQEKRTEGEYIPDPIEEMTGLSTLDRRGQASLMRGLIKVALCPRCYWRKKSRDSCMCYPSHEYAILEARLTVPCDSESMKRKEDAIARIVNTLDIAYEHDVDWLNIIVHDWAGEGIQVAMRYGYDPRAGVPVHGYLVDLLRRYAGCSHSGERNHRKRMNDFLHDAYGDVLNILERRMA